MSSQTAGPNEAVRLSPRRQREALSRLATDFFDVLVVGGGVVGAGAALDAATRGLDVAVVEAQDWASGTSSRSSKLVHGGLRYLQMYDFGLVREALRERAILLRTAPHLVHPVSILYPLRRRVVERAYVTAGVTLYDLLARAGKAQGGLPRHSQLSRRRALQVAPALQPRRFVGAVQYFDGQVDDARHTLAVLRTAATHGAVVASRARVTGLLRERGHVVGATVTAVETGEQIPVKARVVVSTTGIWTEQFGALTGRPGGLRLRPSKGIHLVVPRSCIASSSALILPTDKSVLFVLPWGDHWLIGTTDSAWEHDLARPAACAADVDYLLTTVNQALSRPLAHSDIESVYVGLRPLVAGTSAETTKLSREHAVTLAAPGLVSISGGKYTTYRVMAQDVVDAAVEHAHLRAGPCVTAEVPIVGARGYDQLSQQVEGLARNAGLSTAQVERLLARYGSLTQEVLDAAGTCSSPFEPLVGAGGYLRVEVAYAVTHEGARHLEDVLERRTRTAMETRDRGTRAAAEAAAIMAPLLGWGPGDTASELDAYVGSVAAQVAAEQEGDDESAAARLARSAPLLPLP